MKYSCGLFQRECCAIAQRELRGLDCRLLHIAFAHDERYCVAVDVIRQRACCGDQELEATLPLKQSVCFAGSILSNVVSLRALSDMFSEQ